MRRRSWLIGTCLTAAVAVAALVANTVAVVSAAPIPSVCPSKQPGPPGYSGLLTSQWRLVPFTPDHALLCRYNGMNGSIESPAGNLAGTARLDGIRAVQVAASTNEAAQLPDPGPVSCPMDDASHLDVYYWNSSHRIRVRYLTSGCATATNGGVIAFSISKSNIVRQLEQLTPGKGPSTVRGTILQFGGPLAADGAPPASRPIMGIVALYRAGAGQSTVSGVPARQIRTGTDGKFASTVEPGKYLMVAEALDGTQIGQPQPVTLMPGGTSNVVVRVDVP